MSALAEDPRPDDPYDVRRARNAPGLLRAFNDIGVLAAADVHVAARLTAITGETDATIALAAALAVRAPRLGHVFVDLATIREMLARGGVTPVFSASDLICVGPADALGAYLLFHAPTISDPWGALGER